MKKTITIVSCMMISLAASSQVNTEINSTEFNSLLQDPAIQKNWTALQKLNSKAEVRIEDSKAVYNSYLASLQQSELVSSVEMNAIISKEIFAVETKIKSLNNL